jgi:hypothetical protein
MIPTNILKILNQDSEDFVNILDEINMDEKTNLPNMYGDDYMLPIEIIRDELYYRLRYGESSSYASEYYLQDILIYMATRTTPTKKLINSISDLYKSSIKALDELLKRYEGEKFNFFTNPDLFHIFIGYELMDINSFVNFTTDHLKIDNPVISTYKIVTQVLPIEYLILSYSLKTEIYLFYKNSIKDMIKQLKIHKSPMPSIERMVNIIYNGYSLYSHNACDIYKDFRNEESVLKSFKEIIDIYNDL